ncbi:anti-sigma factor domain-containing protein [Streptomyces sp. NPDC005017]|uniref:anti-sigma factor n=1 Tax=Streptomyces sp. NPDC005017 TaxID=3364706 RepID=UPI0036A8B9A1
MTTEDDPHLAAGAYVLHALPPDEETAFERHLETCPDCRREVAELSETAAGLALIGSEPTPVPDRLLDNLLREIDRTPQDRPPPAARPPARRRGRVLSWALAASVAAAAALGGVAVWQYDRAEDARARTAALQSTRQALTEVLTAPDATVHTAELTGGASAAVVVSRTADRAAFAAAGLPALDDGKVYELWYAAPSGSLRPAGLLPGTGDRSARVLAGPLGEAVAVGITVEPSGGSAQPTSEPLGLIEVGA